MVAHKFKSGWRIKTVLIFLCFVFTFCCVFSNASATVPNAVITDISIWNGVITGEINSTEQHEDYLEAVVTVRNTKYFWTELKLPSSTPNFSIEPYSIYAVMGYLGPQGAAQYKIRYNSQAGVYIGVDPTAESGYEALLLNITQIMLSATPGASTALDATVWDDILDIVSTSQGFINVADYLQRRELFNAANEFIATVGDDPELVKTILQKAGVTIPIEQVKDLFTLWNIFKIMQQVMDQFWTFVFDDPAGFIGFNGKHTGPDDDPYVIACMSATPQSASSNGTVQFSASCSSTYEDTIISYKWAFGDGTIETTSSPNVSHVYGADGFYSATLTVTGTSGDSDDSSLNITVGDLHIGGVIVPGGSLTASTTWNAVDGPYLVEGTVTVPEGVTLTIEPGVRVELNSGASITVQGTLNASGATFTWADGANQWGGIKFDGAGSTNSRLENCVIEHAKGYPQMYNAAWYYEGIIRIISSSPTIIGCTINNSDASHGIWISGESSPLISNNTISGIYNGALFGIVSKDTAAIYVSSWFGNSSPIINSNTIMNSKNAIYIDSSSSGTYQGNMIRDNTSYGFYYSGSSVINARNNYWGDPSGPYDPSDDTVTGGLYNPNGLGDKVSDHVNYFPWLGYNPNSDIHLSGSGYNYPEANFRASLSLDIKTNSLETSWLKYFYSKLRISLSSTSITGVSVSGNTTTIAGEGTVNGIPGYKFEVIIIDGNPDSMRIIIYRPDGSILFDSGLSPLSAGDFNISNIFQYQLTTSVNPIGSGDVTPDCSTGCLYDDGTIVTITASETAEYSFSDWTGCDSPSNNICTMTMDSDKTVSANFQGCQSSVRISGITLTYYPTLQTAYDNAEDADVIESNALTLTEQLIADRNISITLKGGFDCNYEAVIGDTLINGDMTITNGTVTIENISLGLQN